MLPLSASCSSLPPFLIEILLKEILIIRHGFSHIVAGQDAARLLIVFVRTV